MTAASGSPESNGPRRQRFARRPAPVTLTPQKVALLRQVADYGIATAVQVAKLVGPSEQSVRRHLRDLFDGGMVDIVAVPRAVLAAPGEPNDARLLYGSAPNIFRLTRAGQKALTNVGVLDAPRPLPAFGPRNWAYIAHSLAIRDVRLWFELSARCAPGQALETWKTGGAAEIDLERARPPKKLSPDAWCIYRVGAQVLVGMVEVDRGTERGSRRWQEKLTAYGTLFQSGHLKSVTGYDRARVLVFTPTLRRRDSLANFLEKQAEPAIAARFWLADEAVLTVPGLGMPAWRQPGHDAVMPLLEVPSR